MIDLRSHDRDQLVALIPVITKHLNDATMFRWWIDGHIIKAELPSPFVMDVRLGPLDTGRFKGFHFSLAFMDYTYDHERGRMRPLRSMDELIDGIQDIMKKFMPDVPRFKQLSLFD